MKTKWSAIVLLAMISAGLTGCSQDKSSSQLDPKAKKAMPSAFGVCDKVTECADYSYLSYRDRDACIMGITRPVVEWNKEAKSIVKISDQCTEEFNSLLNCESRLTCEQIVEIEYKGGLKGGLNKFCSNEYKQYKDCREANAECSQNTDCETCQSCIQGQCITEPGCVIPACTVDSDCGAFDLRCYEGICVDTSYCMNDAECMPGFLCSYGICIESASTCTSSAQCKEGYECIHGECVHEFEKECTTDSQCGREDFVCMDGFCSLAGTCYINKDCTYGQYCGTDFRCHSNPEKSCKTWKECGGCEICYDGQCQQSTSCNPNYWCDADVECDICEYCGDDNHCHQNTSCDIECRYDAECGKGLTCIENKCVQKIPVCETDADCKDGDHCYQGSCISYTPACTSDADCDECFTCSNGVCNPDPGICPECYGNFDCGNNEYCDNGKCTQYQSCTQDSDCGECSICYMNTCAKIPEICQEQWIKCSTDADCPANTACLMGTICMNVEPTECRSDADCNACDGCMNISSNLCAPIKDCRKCEYDIDCPAGFACSLRGECYSATNGYQYILIEDMSDALTTGLEDGGADIDAIVLRRGNSEFYATKVIDYQHSAGTFLSEYFATDASQALNAPDSIKSSASGSAVCRYFKTVPYKSDEVCEPLYDYPFVSLGGDGGNLLVQIDPKSGGLKPGDVLEIYELGDCAYTNTCNMNSTLADAERISIYVSKDLSSYRQLADTTATQGVISIVIPKDL